MNASETRRLYCVSVNVGMMVYAEDKEDAANIAQLRLEEEAGRLRPASAFIVSDAGQGKRRCYAEGWSDKEIPYGTDDCETVGELFTDIERRYIP